MTDWDFEEWKEDCERTRLHHSYKIQTSTDVYRSVLSAGQNASRAIFLLSAGGTVALLSYAAQRQAISSSIFWALILFSISALLSTALMGIVYLQLNFDRDLLEKSFLLKMLIPKRRSQHIKTVLIIYLIIPVSHFGLPLSS